MRQRATAAGSPGRCTARAPARALIILTAVCAARLAAPAHRAGHAVAPCSAGWESRHRPPRSLGAVQRLRGVRGGGDDDGDSEPPHPRAARRAGAPARPTPPLQGSGRRGRRRPTGSNAPAASERAMDLLPAELRVRPGEDVDEWGRHRPAPTVAQAARPAERASARGAGAGDGRTRRKRRMITFDLARLYPQCAGWNINFTCPLEPTEADLDAASQAAMRAMLERVLQLPAHEVMDLAREACASGIADELVGEGVVPEYLKLMLDPTWEALFAVIVPHARVRSTLRLLYIYMNVCTHTCMHTHTHARTHARTHAHTHTRTHANTRTRAHAHTRTRARTLSLKCTTVIGVL